MNEFTLIDEHGPAPAPLSDDVRDKARGALLAEITKDSGTSKDTETAPLRAKSGRALGVRLAAVAAAVTAAAVAGGLILTNGEPTPPRAGGAAEQVRLVSFDQPAMPPEPRSLPTGVNGPTFAAEPGNFVGRGYADPGDQLSTIGVRVYQGQPDFHGETEDTVHDGEPAVLARLTPRGADGGPDEVTLYWQRGGVWTAVSGSGRFAKEDLVRTVAGSLRNSDDKPELTIRLAPEGWELCGFKALVTTVCDPGDPSRRMVVNEAESYDEDPQLMGTVERSTTVRINGREADLMHLAGGEWWLQGYLPDGRVFNLQIPSGFTQQQVVDVAKGLH